MTDDKLTAKISSFLTREFFKVSNIAIIKNDDGSYEFFNRYSISENPTGYKVESKYNSEIRYFASLKNAVTWCIFENRNKFTQAKRIEYLDQMISGNETAIDLHKKLIRKSQNLEHKLIYIAKLSEEQIRKKQMVQEMASYIAESNTWQTRKFATK